MGYLNVFDENLKLGKGCELFYILVYKYNFTLKENELKHNFFKVNFVVYLIK